MSPTLLEGCGSGKAGLGSEQGQAPPPGQVGDVVGAQGQSSSDVSHFPRKVGSRIGRAVLGVSCGRLGYGEDGKVTCGDRGERRTG